MAELLLLEDDEVDWPLQHPIGRKADQLEEDMHCPICTDFYDNPHLLITCGHSFCSICIRKHFDAKLNPTNSGICPSCRKKGQSADLVKNVALAAVIDRYKVMRVEIFQLLQGSLKKEVSCSEVIVSSVSPGKRNANNGTKQLIQPAKMAGEPILSRIPQFNSHGATLQKIKNHIEYVTTKSKVKLRLDGDKDTLDKRLRELIHQINAQVDHHSPLTLDEVIAKVNKEERMFEEEQWKSKLSAKKPNADNFDELIRRAVESKKRKLDVNNDEVLKNPTENNGPSEVQTAEESVLSAFDTFELHKEESLIFPPSQGAIISRNNQAITDNTQSTLFDPPMSCSAPQPSASVQPTAVVATSASVEIIDLDGDSSQTIIPVEMGATKSSFKKGQWNCPSCTFLNDKLQNRCVMCETENPMRTQATRRSSRTGVPTLKQRKLSTLA